MKKSHNQYSAFSILGSKWNQKALISSPCQWTRQFFLIQLQRIVGLILTEKFCLDVTTFTYLMFLPEILNIWKIPHSPVNYVNEVHLVITLSYCLFQICEKIHQLKIYMFSKVEFLEKEF